ncbi:MAG TPA: hypothetical protein VFW44_16605, partial [Bryobacteraceae bacterium]|nr:hypothetical protein [Bryobacteraceae bacterium]
MNLRTLRLLAGGLVIVLLLVVAGFLISPYISNWRLQSYINDLADDPGVTRKPVGAIRSQILSEAASLGLPIESEDVQVSATTHGVKIDVLYIVHVDLIG